MPSDKPINVEAQRVAKIIDDTERKFKSFVLLFIRTPLGAVIAESRVVR